jgi:hypothetical protein
MAAAASLFSFRPERTLTGLATEPTPAQGALARGRARGEADDGTQRQTAASTFSFDDGAKASEHGLADQFIVFQFSPEPDGPALLDSSAVQPVLAGNKEAPDELARINLVSFHLGRDEHVEPGTRATIRLNFGRDLPALLASDPIFLPTHGLLVPAAIAPSDFAALTHYNPLNDRTCTVFQLKMKSGQLDRTFSFRG